jgi:hypothetical protein
MAGLLVLLDFLFSERACNFAHLLLNFPCEADGQSR